MSIWIHILVFLTALPFAVWLLAAVLGAFEQTPRSIPLIRVGLSLCALIIFLLLTRTELWLPVALACVTVFLLHLGSGWAFRQFALGVPTSQPERLPPLTEDKTEETSDVQEQQQMY